MIKLFIDGKEGTTGLKIAERLAGRAEFSVTALSDDLRKNPDARRDAIAQSDVTLLCLPDSAAVESVELARGTKARIIDASTAHRTTEGWAYGFPELSPKFRQDIQNGNRVAVPGCHASGFVSLVYPLVAAGVLPRDYPLTCHSLTGYSGGGKKMIAEYEAEGRSPLLDAPRQYALTQTHKHQREMKGVCGLDYSPAFNPIVGDFYSGMEVTVPLFTRLLNGKQSAESLHALLSRHYEGSALVTVAPLGAPSFLSAAEMSGSNAMKLYVCGDDERVALVALFDNLGKGASGAAVQCLNIMTGYAETAGLV